MLPYFASGRVTYASIFCLRARSVLQTDYVLLDHRHNRTHGDLPMPDHDRPSRAR